MAQQSAKAGTQTSTIEASPAIVSDGPGYRGRFAPSPTGPLHFGSLLAAMASYLQARKAKGKCLLRIDDIDPPREQAGAATRILHTLDLYGFKFNEPTRFQRHNLSHYESVISELIAGERVYACRCTRKILAASKQGIYPGTCRTLQLEREGNALRIKLPSQTISFKDSLLGEQCSDSDTDIGDFVLLRRDGLFSYQLANVVDDQNDRITEVVRGADLLHDTPRQVALIRMLGLQQPGYMHIPVATNEQGQKLSKQSGAAALPDNKALETLTQAWFFLQQTTHAKCETVSEFWAFAEKAWNPSLIPMVTSQPYNPAPANT